MKIDQAKAKLYSTIGPRATLGMVALDIVKENKNLMVLTSDVSTSAGLDRFRKQNPENYIDVGISEQNLINVATGISTLGFDVITTTFAPFQTMRCLEQIKVNLGYMKKKITMVGLASGLILGPLGFTHCSIEDNSVMRSIPNIAVINPCDGSEVAKAIHASLKYENSVYIRLTGGPGGGMVYDNDYEFKIGEPIKIHDGDDGVVFSTGAITFNCLKAVREISSNNKINLSLINIHTLKPINEEKILRYIKPNTKIFSFEEHSRIGGLSTIISEIIVKNKLKLKSYDSFAINDEYSNSGYYQYMLDKNLLSFEKILKTLNSNFT
jgi:transketolase